MRKQTVTKDLYKKVVEETNTTKKYRKILPVYSKTLSGFEQELTEQQKKQLYELIDLLTDMSEELNLQFFSEGFRLGVKLTTEVYNKEDSQ